MLNRCPHCLWRADIRTSREVTRTTRELYLQCTNFRCGHTWKSILTVQHTIVPSASPDPAVFVSSRLKTVQVDERQLSFLPPSPSG